MKMDFRIVPHAIFTYPQIASVGLTEVQARKEYGILVGRAKHSDIVKGEAHDGRREFCKGHSGKRHEKDSRISYHRS